VSITPYHIWLSFFSLLFIFVFFALIPFVWFAVILCIELFVFGLGVWQLSFNFFGKSFCKPPSSSLYSSLTFDDGPDPELTPFLLDLLDHYKFRATFFLIAAKANKHPALVKEIIQRGHHIGCHDLSHSITSNFRLSKSFHRDIHHALQILTRISGVTPRFYRPPVGLSNPHLFPVLKKLDLHCIGWNQSSGDAGNRCLKGIHKIPTLARKGSIILLHDCLPRKEYRQEILHAFDTLFKRIKNEEIPIISLEKLLDTPAYQNTQR